MITDFPNTPRSEYVGAPTLSSPWPQTFLLHYRGIWFLFLLLGKLHKDVAPFFSVVKIMYVCTI